jgi:large subunit ribosomal protein L5
VKVVANMGLGEAVQNPKIIESATAELTAITGRKPIVNRAKKAIATFQAPQRDAHRRVRDAAP